MDKAILTFYSSLRHVFGLCPNCESIFRISGCKLYQKKKPEIDWMDKIDRELAKLDRLEASVEEKIALAREAARVAGRREADKRVKQMDPIFRPMKLNPNDAKVIFHPVDFVVFNGMTEDRGFTPIKNLVLLDKKDRQGEHLRVQGSIEKAVDQANYEWLTLRVKEDGSIVEE